ncbi:MULTISPECIES: undecaprenyl-diphosphate phosphatase [unclassified Frankia]|uniref:undecaprenyl-diphosphate phosphatase n=1 Tax=unclassified Frankia TaxID=2632575 RepID=UPI0020251DB9
MGHFGFVEAGAIGLLQGITELFPVSSLGHSVLVPAWIGGSWARDLDVSAPESPYLAFIVAVHVATAIALITFYWRDWVRITSGLTISVRDRRVQTSDQRLGWLLIIATIPVGISGLLLEHTFRTTLGKPLSAALFLTVNGGVLLAGERLRRRNTAPGGPGSAPAPVMAAPITGRFTAGKPTPTPATGASEGATPGSADPAPLSVGAAADLAADQRLATLSVKDALVVGFAQAAALAPGISRSGVSMVAGLIRGLSHEDAARFAFLLATPVILAAGLLKLPDLFGPLGNGVRGQTLFGAAVAGVAAYLSVRFLSRWFETRTLTPFAFYCLAVGFVSVLRFGPFSF